MAQSNIPVIEIYWNLVHKADKKFSRVRDLPYCGRNRYDTYFNKVFKVYTQLWKFQAENRQKLVEAGVKRWEIGEIASRIAQIYYGQYLRTSEASYLSESYIFYEAILSREYFKEGLSEDLNLASKQLRCLARFIMVCLISNRREIMHQLVKQLKILVDECKRNFQETDFKEWKQVVQEIDRFLKADSDFMNIKPLRFSVVLDSQSESLSAAASFEGKRPLRLREAILTSYHPNEVKVSEITLDTFRMLQCLEWEPRGSFYQTNVSPTSGSFQNASMGPSRIILTDPTLPPNPRKAILYHPTVTHFLAVLALICEELPLDGVLLIYLSASGKVGHNIQLPSSSGTFVDDADDSVRNVHSHDMASAGHSTSPLSSVHDILITSSGQSRRNDRNNQGCLCLGSHGNSGSNCIYPCDLIPFTRRPLFFIIDSDNSQAFKVVNGAEMVEPAAMLLSPSSPTPTTGAADSSRHSSGNQFTMFLTTPLQAFCILIGISGSNVEMDAYNKAENLLSSSLVDWGLILTASDTLDPVWAQVLCDPFLRRLILRFIFCRAVLSLYVPTFKKDEFLPACLPDLPECVLPSSPECQTVVQQMATLFSATNQFLFSDDSAS